MRFNSNGYFLFKFWKDFLVSGPLHHKTASRMKFLPVLLCAFSSYLSVAQVLPPAALPSPAPSSALFPTAVYPTGYFRNPLDIPIKLAANFGELRANHYHMG